MSDSIPATKTAPRTRLWGLDQARAVAILAMMVFHFAPGVFVQLPKLDPFRLPTLLFGRAATPMFVAVFGVTAGFVFLPKFIRDSSATTRRLLRRSLLVLFCALLVTIPTWIMLFARGELEPMRWLFATYSVLMFYALGIATLPLVLRFLAPQPFRRALPLGAGVWILGTWGFQTWPGESPSPLEFTRLLILSGDYGYLQMLGTATLAIPFGYRLRQACDRGEESPMLRRMFLGGLLLCACGAAWGASLGEYDVEAIVAGELRIPPRAWYFLHFGSLALVGVAGLELLTRHAPWLGRPMYALAVFGQVSLLLYCGHLFVLPGLALLDAMTPLKGMARVAAAFLPFGLFCIVVMSVRHRQNQAGKAVTGSH